jgi:N-acetylmuramoyl-L-alanine amidase CwlA
VKQEYLTPNSYSRPQRALKKVNAVVVHYTANVNTSAESNRSYFNGLATSHTTHASAHFIIDQDGTILQIIPLTEIAYANYPRNYDTISIECCYKDSNGKFTNTTYQSLIALVKALMSAYNLDSGDVIRHYDVTGKLCPLYYVRNPKEWTLFKERLDGWNIFGIIYL